MASGNQLIQDYATIQNQLGDYFNTITLNVSSISSFGTLGSVGNLLTLNPDGGSVDITTLPNLVSINSNITGINYDGVNTLFTTQTQVIGNPFIVETLGGSKTEIIAGEVECHNLLALSSITAYDSITAISSFVNQTYTNKITDASNNIFFRWDSNTGHTSTSATSAFFSTITYSQLNPPPQILVPTTFYSGTATTSIVNTAQSNADLIGHTPFTTTQTGYITANATAQFENTANSQIHTIWSFMRLTDASGAFTYYETNPIAHSIEHRISESEPYYVNTSLLLRSTSNLPADTYNIAVYAYAEDSVLTLTSSRCDILAYSGLT
jgi:hypothetical protein